ncbi:MAG: hypothetical protein ACE5EH_11440 [Gammaproteobacteria bacterium]
MTNSIELDSVKSIQNTQRKISMTMGITMGMLLLVYFFSYANLIDHGLIFIVNIEIVTSILFVIAFFFLNKISFFLTRLRYSRNNIASGLILLMKPGDVNQEPDKLYATLEKLRKNNDVFQS